MNVTEESACAVLWAVQHVRHISSILLQPGKECLILDLRVPKASGIPISDTPFQIRCSLNDLAKALDSRFGFPPSYGRPQAAQIRLTYEQAKRTPSVSAEQARIAVLAYGDLPPCLDSLLRDSASDTKFDAEAAFDEISKFKSHSLVALPLFAINVGAYGPFQKGAERCVGPMLSSIGT